MNDNLPASLVALVSLKPAAANFHSASPRQDQLDSWPKHEV
jgi:hypothetical protein